MIRTIWGCNTYFFEIFRRGEWETSDLYALLLFGELNETSVDKVMKSTMWRRLIEQVLHKLNQNSIKGSKRNIAAHYDLGNEFYQLWLDRTMTYSSALFEGDTVSLSEAQRQKYLRIAKKIELKMGTSCWRSVVVGEGLRRLLLRNMAAKSPHSHFRRSKPAAAKKG